VRPIIAIVGRPNVGKSTLFNRLAGRRLAIVHDEPGVTRDRHYADTHLQGREVTIIDTGGFDPDTDDPMGQGIARHVESAIEEADVILCVLDGQGAPTQADLAAVKLLRHSSKPVVYTGNRADNQRLEHEAVDLHRLGIDPLVFISALHGRNMARLESELVRRLPPIAGEDENAEDESVPRVALIGRPNAGKSSLLNHLSGTERSLVDERPGTTRDPIDVRISYQGQDYLVVDTAGIRRKSRVGRGGVEAASVIRAIRTIDRAHIVILMCDTALGMAEQDQRLLGLCAERSRAIVVGMNKLDLLNREERKQQLDEAKTKLHFAPWAPVVGLSAKSGQGVSDLMRSVKQAHREFHKRISTGQLNEFFAQVLERHPPPTHGGRAPRLNYITQAGSAPPLFVAMTNAPDNIKTSYQRFVLNQIRQSFGFESVPLKLVFRAKRRRE